MWKKFEVSAPGKIILFGEHAVVYGKEALACAINLRSYCTVEVEDYNGDSVLQISAADMDLCCSISRDIVSSLSQGFATEGELPVITNNGLMQVKSLAEEEIDTMKALTYVLFLSLYLLIGSKDASKKSVKVSLSSQLPIGAGLGSSASYATCIATGFLLAFNKLSVSSDSLLLTDGDRTTINHYVFESEKIVHGSPSGVDNTICVHGGALSFKGGDITYGLRLPPVMVLVVDTKVSRSTKQMVAGVKERHGKHTKLYELIFDTIQEVTTEGKNSLLRMAQGNLSEEEVIDCYSCLQDYIKLNGNLLRCIGVSHPAIERVTEICQEYGLSSKLTGAGGGGCSFALVPPVYSECKLDELRKALDGCGYVSWIASIGDQGVLIEAT